MKRLFLIDTYAYSDLKRFVKIIQDTIPNISYVDYHNILFNPLLSNLKIDNTSIEGFNLMVVLDKFLYTKAKNNLIFRVIEQLHRMDSPNAMIFIIITDRIMEYHIRKEFKGVKTVKTIKFNTAYTDKKNPYRNSNNSINRYHEVIKIPKDCNDKQFNRIALKFINKHIPVKLVR